MVTELILAAGKRSVAAFWALSVSYYSTVSVRHSHYDTKLMPQIALRLMESLSHDHDWETAFGIYNCLLSFGVSYSMGSEYLLEAHTSTISLIVEVCINSNNITTAVEVMRSCLWLSVGEQDDLRDRLMCAVNVGVHCISSNFLEAAIECINAVSVFVNEEHRMSVISFANNVVSSLLQNSQITKALKLSLNLVKTNLCSRSALSCMMHSAFNQHELEGAKHLCLAAYKSGVYEDLAVNGDKFTLRFSSGFTPLEIECLLKTYFLKFQVEKVTSVVKILFVSGIFAQ